jgi:PAS domain S-box-containing protein
MSGVKRENPVEQLQTHILALKQENKNLLLLFKNAAMGHLHLDCNQVIKDADLATAWIFDCAIADLEAKKLITLLHPNDQNDFQSFLKKLSTATKIETCKVRINSDNNIVKIVGFHGIAINNQKTEILLTLEDVTEPIEADKKAVNYDKLLRLKVSNQNFELNTINEELQKKVLQLKIAQHEIQDKEAKLNSIFNATIEGIITINESGMVESINTAITDIFGYQAEELVGSNIRIIMPSPYNKLHNNYLLDYIQTGISQNIGHVRELEGKRKNGSLVSLELSIAEYKINNKQYFTGLIRDISERKRKEQLEKQHLDELAHVARLGLMGELASGIAHEINQPLTAIAAYSQVNMRLIDNDEPDLNTIHETLHKISDQAVRAGSIIRRMREFISNQTQHLSTVDINQLVKDAVELCCDECKQLDIKVIFDLEQSMPGLSIDHIQIEQVIINLVKNSIDALASTPNGTLRLLNIATYLKDKQNIEVRVKDNGSGIGKIEQNQLFNPFFTTKENGMGMGLSISRSIIEAHDGTLRFNTKEGKGSTFYFTLPVIGAIDDT